MIHIAESALLSVWTPHLEPAEAEVDEVDHFGELAGRETKDNTIDGLAEWARPDRPVLDGRRS
jgi:hypothetical protein